MTPRYSIVSPLGWSVASIAAAMVFIAYGLFSLVPTATLASTAANDLPMSNSMLERHHDLLARYQQGMNGRSLFFKPQADPPVVVIHDPPPVSQPVQVASPVVDRYTGPSLIALVGAKAWFKPAMSGAPVLRLSLGQEQAGLTLVSVDAPWTADVQYHGRPYTLTLFDEHTTDRFLRERSAFNEASNVLMSQDATMLMDDDLFGDQGSNR